MTRRLIVALLALLTLAPAAEAAKLQYLKGATSVFVDVFVQDASSTTGAGLTGLVFNSAGLVCYYARADQGNAGGTAITLASATLGTYTSGSFKEKDATNMPGVYELGLPTGVLATGSNYAIVLCKGATNMAPLVLEIQLAGLDIQDAVRAGLTALPNAAAEGAGGLYTRGTGAGQINQPANGMVDTNTVRWNGTAVATPATAGIPDINVKNINNVAAATPGASGGVLISGSNSGTTTLGALTVTGATTLTGNVVLSDGLTISAPSTLNRAGLDVTGNGTGAAVKLAAGATGKGIAITTTAGDGLSITPTAGSAIVATANGTSKHGMIVTGGTAGTSHGAQFVAGTGGSDIFGNLNGSVASCTGCSTAGGATILPEAGYVKGSTSVVHEIFIKDSATNLGKTGLTNASTGLTIAFGRSDQGNAAYTTCAAQAATRGAYTSCGFVEKDATNAAGWYELGLTTAMLATGADYVTVSVFGVSGTTPSQIPIALVDTGLAAINTKLGTPAGASMSADIAAVQTSATAIKGKTDSLSFTGSDLGVIVNNYASGKGPLQSTVAGRTLDVSAGGGAGLDWANVKSPTTTVDLSGTTHSTSQAVASVSGAVGSVTGAVGSVTGAVGSVTGAVGSVTGNVGGNVVGSVASVTGNVGGNVVGSVASVTGNVGGNVVGSVASVTGAVGSVTGAVGSVTGAVGSVTGNVGGNVTGNVTGTLGSLAAQAQTDVANSLGGRVGEAAGSYTYDQMMRIMFSILAGRTNTSGTVFKTPDNSVGRATFTIDGSNNRTGSSLTP